jgi:hypothetical protein
MGADVNFARVFLVMVAAGLLPAAASAQEVLRLPVGEASTIKTTRGIRNVAVGDPSVVSLTVVTDQTVVVNAKANGRTNIILFDEDGAEIRRNDVVVGTPSAARPAVQSVLKFQGGTNAGAIELACSPFCVLPPPPTIVVQGQVNGGPTATVRAGQAPTTFPGSQAR